MEIEKTSIDSSNKIKKELLPIKNKIPTNIKKDELEILKHKLEIAKAGLENVLWYIVTEDCRKMVENTLKEINNK
jgi:hypothetical protein